MPTTDFNIKWDEPGERYWETGVDRGVLYPDEVTDPKESATKAYTGAVAWNGLTSVTETPSGAEANDLYADNMLYASLRSAEKFGGTIEAYMYPDEFAKCNGEKSPTKAVGVYVGQQKRSRFGFAYRSDLGTDKDSTVDVDTGYKLHLWYNCTASTSERQFQTVNDSPEVITMSWEITTTPVKLTTEGFAPTALIVIDSTKADAAKLAALETALYGTGSTAGYLPTPDQVLTMMMAQ